MSGPFGSSQWMYSSGAAVEGQSLRFNDDDSAYLSWTPSAAGNRKTWTWSGWFKRGNIGSEYSLFSAHITNTNQTDIYLNSTDTIVFNDYQSTTKISAQTSAVFRDPSAWYHIVVAVDTTQSTNSDGVKVYINGVQQTLTFTAYTQNLDTMVSSTNSHKIGSRYSSSPYYLDGYLSEVNFVDGTAYDPTSFGETDANGQWVPITSPSVTYGTNGYYLPFTNDYEVEGFNTVTYRGTGAEQYVGGVGFDPDFLWIKRREGAENHILQDSVRGAARQLFTNTTEAELSGANNVQSFETDGFVVGTDSGSNGSGRSFVAWAWDAGTGSAASNTDGSITSLVKANPDYGFSIVSYTGTGANATVGHGLSSAPEIAIFKNRDTSSDWRVYYHVDGLGSGVRYVALNSTAASVYDPNIWQNTTASNTVLKIGSASQVNGSSNDLIAYCFHSVAGYSDFGNYTGNGSSTGPTVTTGFKPAFLILKRTDGVNSWTIQDNTRDPSNPIDLYLLADDSGAEGTSGLSVDFLSNGFQIKTTSAAVNASGGTYIYMAFADKREAAFWLDQSGNNNDWTNNNMQESDISLDSPTNNFSTFNPIDPHGGNASTLSEGNLKASSEGSNSWSRSTYWIESGAYYCEILSQSSSGQHAIQGNYGNTYFSWTDNGQMVINGTSVGTYSSHTSGDIIGLAIDRDANTVKFYKNNTLVYTGTSLSSGAIKVGSFFAPSSGSAIGNFGQDSSFAGSKAAQGNQDANGKGDFYYEPPAGYLALCTDNLPDPAIADGSEHFNTVLYTGDGSSNRTISGVGFQPDLTWLKGRSTAVNHRIADSLRQYSPGAYYLLSSNLTATEVATFDFSAFTSDGFTISDAAYDINDNTTTYAAWNWKAGGTGVANTDGSISSTVSANPTAGFSIVGYASGASGDKTVGHGLSSAPEMIITKSRDSATYNWSVFHADAITATTKFLRLNTTDSIVTSASNIWGSALPTSSVFGITSGNGVVASTDCIAYCFHSVEGYSKFGSYTGSGSADGPFVYTGFRPAFLIIKRSSSTGSWQILDNKRDPENADPHKYLYANLSNAEGSSTTADYDVLSNGFKPRNTTTDMNASGSTYIYMAFAESPFKYSNAR